jgi:hypothetical protein
MEVTAICPQGGRQAADVDFWLTNAPVDPPWAIMMHICLLSFPLYSFSLPQCRETIIAEVTFEDKRWYL